MYKVSDFALDKILEQLKLPQEGERSSLPCKGQFTKSWGLPCYHYVRVCLETHVPIRLEDIHEQWVLERNPLMPSFIVEGVTREEVVSPRSVILRRLSATFSTVESQNPRFASLIARFNHVLDTPHIEVEEPSVVIKKRGRPAGSKKNTSTTRDKSQFEYVEGRRCGVS